jgi:hypothetical protein
MGAFIGDALALGPHWYYDLDELHRDYGEWISDYTDPKPGRYHAGRRSGRGPGRPVTDPAAFYRRVGGCGWPVQVGRRPGRGYGRLRLGMVSVQEFRMIR